MDGKTFIQQQLASTGWAPINADFAEFLTPDARRARGDLEAGARMPETLLRQFERTALCRARVGAFGDVLILYRSPANLAERISYLSGYRVALIEDAALADLKAPIKAVHPKAPSRAAPKEDVEARLRNLAAQEPPAHECALRREILAARAALGEA